MTLLFDCDIPMVFRLMEYQVPRVFLIERVVHLLTLKRNMLQFQKREYAKVALFRCGKKGHGLQAKEHIPKGSFVIEYVGEVCRYVLESGGPDCCVFSAL